MVGQKYMIKIEYCNTLLMESIGFTTKAIIENEFAGYHTGLLKRMWEYAKMSGVREHSGFTAASME